jgi:hypothetical protein
MGLQKGAILIKRIFKIFLVALGFHFIVSGLNYIYVNAEQPWYRIMWHHYYEDEGKIDCIILGSSHVYCDINPTLLNNINKNYWFNLASPSQRLVDSYYLLKEADHGNELSHVYLELYYDCSTKDNLKDNIDPIQDESICERSWQNIDFMKDSLNKVQYMLSIFRKENITELLFPFCRYRTKLGDWNYIKQTVEEKQKEDYQNYEYCYYFDNGNGHLEYREQGYFYSTREFWGNLFEQSRILEENPIGHISEQYLRKIISYCQKRSIPITLFVSPMNDLQLVSTENYDNFIQEVSDIAKEYSIDFYDFNLVREGYLPIYEKEYFYDMGHLNSAGATLFTSFFNKVVTGSAADNEKYFYSSYKEKMQETPAKIYGLYYKDTEVRTFHIASNREEELEYKVVITPANGEPYMIQDFSTNKVFSLPLDQHGVCAVSFREINERDGIIQICETVL